MTNIRVLVGVLAVLVLVVFTAGCGLVSDQTKQEIKKKLKAKGQQAKEKVDELLKKVDAQQQQNQKK